MQLESVSTKEFANIPFEINISLLRNQWDYFFKSPNKARPIRLPDRGQICYVNLGIGYPCEIYGGHWCYVLKNLSHAKILVIPLTSVKHSSSEPDENYQLDIHIKDFYTKGISRLQLSDMRVIDTQRIYVRKGFYNTIDTYENLKQQISDKLSL